ncbi:MAG: Do family serine endopeptidase [Bacteroidota bacterium]
MHPSQSNEELTRPALRRTRRYVAAGLLLGASLIGLAAVMPAAPSIAQLKPNEPSVQTPFGRAPLSFADIVDRVRPAVVSIQVTSGAKVARNSGRGTREPFPDLPDDHPFNEFFKNLPKEFRGMPSPNARPALAQGSGFVISPDGYIVTNNHVVDGANKIQVSFDENNKYDAELVGTDARTDVALLKIKASKPLPYVKFAEKPVRVGDWVIAVGNPFGLGGTVTAGIVSALSRDIGSGPYDYMQIDAAVNRGNSGGPTFNLDGEVIGVNTAIYSPSGGSVGIAFAVPSKTAAEVVSQLKSSGSVSRGWLGVKIESVDEDKAASLGLGEARGALVNEVTQGGPAAGSGLKAGDVIVAVNGEKIHDSRELARKIAEYSPRTKVNIEVYRFGKTENVSVSLGNFPAAKELARLEQEPSTPGATELSQLGISLSASAAGRNGPKEGVVISDVDSDSDAATKGLKTGDVILEVQGQQVASPADVEAGVRKAKELGRKAVLLRIKSGDSIRFVAVQLKPA